MKPPLTTVVVQTFKCILLQHFNKALPANWNFFKSKINVSRAIADLAFNYYAYEISSTVEWLLHMPIQCKCMRQCSPYELFLQVIHI